MIHFGVGGAIHDDDDGWVSIRWALLTPEERERRQVQSLERTTRIIHEMQKSRVHTMQYRINKAALHGSKPIYPPLPAQPTPYLINASPSSPLRESPDQHKRQATEMIRIVQERNRIHLAEVKKMIHHVPPATATTTSHMKCD